MPDSNTSPDMKWDVPEGSTSSEQLEYFRRYTKEHPDVVWTSAEAHRYDGLTLFRQDGDTLHVMRFTAALCGFEGTGPSAAISILTEAGFGHFEHIEHRILYKYERDPNPRRFTK